jgi:hypothetical protein
MNKEIKIDYADIEEEGILLLIKKKSETSYWEYSIFGILSYFLNYKKDYLIITKKRIVYIIRDEILKNSFYSDFSSIKFNSLNDIMSYKTIDNKNEKINLKNFRITYEEIQKLKEILN